MNATESTAYISVQSTVRSLENLKTQEYLTYWQYRMSQPDHGTAFDPTFTVTLSTAQRAAYQTYYAGLGYTTQQIADAITTLENSRTAEYRQLNDKYGKLGDTFDPTYRYDTAVTQKFGVTAIDGGSDAVTLKGNVFSTGQAIVFHAGGGAVGGLTDGHTYYAVVDANDPSIVRFAATLADATSLTPTLLDLDGTASGSGNYFSAAALTFDAAGVNTTDNTLSLARAVFQTGQAVVYHRGGGSIAGLTDGATYYVVVDTDDPTRLALSTSHANATAGTPVTVDLGTITGSGNQFSLSEADVLADKAAWSDSQLKNSFSAKILGPKGVAGTTGAKEDANIIGQNITLRTFSGDIGGVDGTIDIVLPVTTTLSDAQKKALAAAEPEDVTFYADAAGK